MFVLLDGGTEPLLAMLCEVLVRQERYSERNVWLGWCKIAEKEGFVDDVVPCCGLVLPDWRPCA